MAEVLRLSPAICAYPDEKYENLKIEVILPGIEKENRSFKLAEDGFYVKATKEGVEYVDSYSICCPVNTDKAVATYSKGILKVTVPYQEPFENAVDVKIE